VKKNRVTSAFTSTSHHNTSKVPREVGRRLRRGRERERAVADGKDGTARAGEEKARNLSYRVFVV
jgi:hypothetical protein